MRNNETIIEDFLKTTLRKRILKHIYKRKIKLSKILFKIPSKERYISVNLIVMF